MPTIDAACGIGSALPWPDFFHAALAAQLRGQEIVARKIRWGVISTAEIGTGKVIPGMQRSKRGVVAAIASRDLKRAKRAAAKLGIEKAYGSYEALIADPTIDAIYNPLPNNLHIDWTIAALKAGKHVLCEKPFGMNAKDASRVLEACRRKDRDGSLHGPLPSAMAEGARAGPLGQDR